MSSKAISTAPLLLLLWLVSCNQDTTRRSAEDPAYDGASEVIGSFASATHWVIGEKPVVSIGGQAGPQQFFRVADALRTSTGRIVVANAGAEVRIFEPNGSILAQVGGEGSGPGEFRDLSNLFLGPGDTIIAIDDRLQRISVLDPDGRFVRAHRVRAPGVAGRVNVVDRFDDGRFLAWSARPVSNPATTGLRTDSMLLLLLDEHGMLIDSLGRLPAAPLFIERSGRSFSVAVLPLGSRGLMEAAGSRLILASGRQAQVQVFSWSVDPASAGGGLGGDRSGFRLSQTISWLPPPARLSEDDLERMADRYVARFRAANQPEARRTFAAMPIPSSVPPVRGLVGDAAGRLWIRLGRVPLDLPLLWLVWDLKSRAVVAVAETPRSLAITDIGRDCLVGIRRDSLGVETIEVHRVPSAPSR